MSKEFNPFYDSDFRISKEGSGDARMLVEMYPDELEKLRDEIDAVLKDHGVNKAASQTEMVRSRVDKLRVYKENDVALKQAEEQKKQNLSEELIGKIKALKPRIDELISTGNACLQAGIPMTGQAWGMRESYDTHQFFTNSWSHLVGFVGRPGAKDFESISMLGINAGGACGSYDFRTDGVKVYSVHEQNPWDVQEPSIGHMQRFLNTFDNFESAFYAYVDKEIEKQQKSIDSIISDAAGRAEHSGVSSAMAKQLNERDF